MRGFVFLTVGALFFACSPPPPPPPQPPTGTGPWDVSTPRTVSYAVTNTSPSGSQTTPATLSFTGGGQLSLEIGGTSLGSFTMSPQGALSSQSPGQPPPAAFELLSALPSDKAALSQVGASWQRGFPDDQAVASSPSTVFVRSLITGTTKAVTGDLSTVSLVGSYKLERNQGLKETVRTYFGDKPSAAVEGMLLLLTQGNQYLVGEMVVDLRRGEVVSLVTRYVRFPRRSMSANEIATAGNREEMRLARN